MNIYVILHQFFQQNSLNLVICLCSMVFSIVAILLIQINRNIDARGAGFLSSLGVLNFILALGYLIELVLTGQGDPLLNDIVWWAVTLEYFVPYLLSCVMTEYLFHRIENSNGYIAHKWIPRVIYGLIFAMTCYFVGTGRYYGVSYQGYYYRSDLYIVSQVIGILLVAMNLCYLMLSSCSLSRKEKNALLAYFLAPVCAVVIQLFGTGIYVMEIAMTLSMLMIAVYLQHIQAKRYYSREKDLAELKMLLLLSQLRPHFLYNALSSISQLCKKNPEQASEMTDRFAEYLRKNMRDIKNNELIPFETEIEHIKNYIAIEQMRYADLIKTEYDIQVRDFEIPSFVLQPLVENSIRHGLYKKEEGGTIRISTRLSGKMVILTVSDDGVGFEMKKRQDKEPHLGIESVRKRVETVPHANFMLSSVPGMGTTAVIMIPYLSKEETTSANGNDAIEEIKAEELAETAEVKAEVKAVVEATPAMYQADNAQIISLDDARREMQEREEFKVIMPDDEESMEEDAIPKAGREQPMTQEEKVRAELSALEAILEQKSAM